MFLNKYSFYQTESEILIKRNSILFVKDIEYETIIINGKNVDVKVIVLELSDIDLDIITTTTLSKQVKFKKQIIAHDQYRNLDFTQTFPELAQYI